MNIMYLLIIGQSVYESSMHIYSLTGVHTIMLSSRREVMRLFTFSTCM